MEILAIIGALIIFAVFIQLFGGILMWMLEMAVYGIAFIVIIYILMQIFPFIMEMGNAVILEIRLFVAKL